MTEAACWKMPWGLVLTLTLIAGNVLLPFALRPPDSGTPPAEAVAGAIVAAIAVFLTLAWLHYPFWGLIAALLLPWHPAFLPWRDPGPHVQGMVAAELLTLAMTILGMDLASRARPVWRTWLAVLLASLAAVGHAWHIQAVSGLVGSLLLVIAFLLGLASAWKWASSSNLLLGVVLALVVSVGGWLLGSLPTGTPVERLQEALAVTTPHWDQDWAAQWGWPALWLTGPLAGWGLICSVRRGFWQRGRRQAPTAWALTAYALLTLVRAAVEDTPIVRPMAVLVMLLAVFGVADTLRGAWDRLRLPPPEEREC